MEMDKACDKWWEDRMKGIDWPAPWIKLPAHLERNYVPPEPNDRKSHSDDEEDFDRYSGHNKWTPEEDQNYNSRYYSGRQYRSKRRRR
jgi:hypothetical protein